MLVLSLKRRCLFLVLSISLGTVLLLLEVLLLCVVVMGLVVSSSFLLFRGLPKGRFSLSVLFLQFSILVQYVDVGYEKELLIY